MEDLQILVADDHDIIRHGIRTLIEQRPGWMVVAEATEGRQAVQKVLQLNPHVAILDIRMPILNGLEAAREIQQKGSKTRILILTMHEEDHLIQQMLEAGVRGYVLKSDAANDLFTAIEALQHGHTFFSTKVREMIVDHSLKGRKESRGTGLTAGRLTKRQREILKLFAEGKTCRDVAAALGLSTKTVETHRSAMMRRADCHSIAEFIRFGLRNGLVTP